jgi:hypothetical protein
MQAAIYNSPLSSYVFYDRKRQEKSQVIARDSLPKKQHIQLRKLIIAWFKTAGRGE